MFLGCCYNLHVFLLMIAGGEYYPPCSSSNSVCMTGAHSIDESRNASVYTSFLLDASLLRSVESDCLEGIVVGHDEAGKVHIWPCISCCESGSAKGPTAFKLPMVCWRGSCVLFTETEQV